ncbi:hypothetical protein GF389_06195 [Candidatus Dojkabacteria bacterium]|nr:hypothetical protein [Candidatus Dojkabacteria bacterium]
MFIGALVYYMTFPGILAENFIVNNLARRFKVKKVRVETNTKKKDGTDKLVEESDEVKYYWDFGFRELFVISITNFLLLTLLSCLTYIVFGFLVEGGPSNIPDKVSVLQGIVLWLGISFGVHSFPKYYWSKFINTDVSGFSLKTLIKTIYFVFLFLMIIVRYVWGDFLYAILLLHLTDYLLF